MTLIPANGIRTLAQLRPTLEEGFRINRTASKLG